MIPPVPPRTTPELLDRALHQAKLLIEDREDTTGVAVSVLMLRTLIAAIDTANQGDVLSQLMCARQQNEHILASLRRLYEEVRTAQEQLSSVGGW